MPVYDPVTGAITDGERYEDLHIAFYLADSDGLDTSEFSAPDQVAIERQTGSWESYLQGMVIAGYAQAYSVRYPVVVSVWDDKLKDSFKFGTYVYMKDNNIGTGCSSPPVLPPSESTGESYDDFCLKDATYVAKVKVKYDDGSNVAGSMVSFAGCTLGTTGSGVAVIGKVPPVWGSLTVTDGENEYTEVRDYTEVSDITITIPRKKRYNFMFRTVEISKNNGVYRVDAVKASTESVKLEMTRDGDAASPPDPLLVLNIDPTTGLLTTSVARGGVPIDTYDVLLATYDTESVSGVVTEDDYTMPATAANIYVYSPVMEGFSSEEDIEGIAALYAACGIEPISAEPQSTTLGCTWTG